MVEDVELAYGIPLTIDSVKRIPGAEVYPVGCQDQHIINKEGGVIPKKQVIHGLSFNKREGRSINQRVGKEELPRVVFGQPMLHFLHIIHHLRWNHL